MANTPNVPMPLHLNAVLTAMPTATPLEQLVAAWPLVPEEQLLCFLIERLTPRMRQRLLYGLDDEENTS